MVFELYLKYFLKEFWLLHILINILYHQSFKFQSCWCEYSVISWFNFSFFWFSIMNTFLYDNYLLLESTYSIFLPIFKLGNILLLFDITISQCCYELPLTQIQHLKATNTFLISHNPRIRERLSLVVVVQGLRAGISDI